jgi:acetylornithine deacetylase
VLELLDRAIAEEIKRDPDFECKVDLVRSDGGFETSVDSKLVSLMEGISGRSATTVAFGTEAPQMIQLGAESVVFGPGDIRVAHRTGEFVPISELNACVEMLSKAVKTLCR